MTIARVAGHDFDLSAELVEQAVAGVEPEPIHQHYVVIKGRRYPPKQVLAVATGLDRADFTTHQARAVLRRLGFGAYRVGPPVAGAQDDRASWPHGGAEAELLSQYIGRWVAQDGLNVLYDADSPEAIIKWLRRHNRKATVWRIPSSPRQMGSWNVTER